MSKSLPNGKTCQMIVSTKITLKTVPLQVALCTDLVSLRGGGIFPYFSIQVYHFGILDPIRGYGASALITIGPICQAYLRKYGQKCLKMYDSKHFQETIIFFEVGKT